MLIGFICPFFIAVSLCGILLWFRIFCWFGGCARVLGSVRGFLGSFSRSEGRFSTVGRRLLCCSLAGVCL